MISKCRDLKMKQTNISLIQEPWARGSKIHGFGQLHDRLFYHRTGNRPRTAVYVSPTMNGMILNQLSNEDLTVVRICRNSIEGGDFLVASCYLPYDSPTSPPGSDFERLVNFSVENDLQLILGCDSNSYHTIWGSKANNSRGNALIQYLATSDLTIVNKGRKPTFVNKIRKERLNITLATYGISERIHSWAVSDEENFSDHKLITFCLKAKDQPKKPFRNPRKTDWSLYREYLRESLCHLEVPDRIHTPQDPGLDYQ